MVRPKVVVGNIVELPTIPATLEQPLPPPARLASPPASLVVDAFVADLARPGLRDDAEVQAGVIERLRSLLPNLPNPEQVRVLESLALALDRPPRWIEQLTKLSTPDMRRALRSRPVALNRKAGETLYPIDGWLGAYLLYTQETEAPLGWHFWCGAALLSIVARRNFYWDRGRYYLFLNQYVLLLGASGLTKSTTVNQATGVFDELVEIAKSGSVVGLDPIYKSPERITAARLLQDLSNWAKTYVGSSTRRDTILFVVSDELATLLGRDVKGSDQLADLLTDIYMGKRTHRDATILGGDRTLVNVASTCLLATTADSARRNITENMFSEGFMGRVVTVPRSEPHDRYPTPPSADPVTRRLLAEQLAPWLLIDQEIELRIDANTNAWYESWYYAHRAQAPQDPKLNAFWNRKADHMFRLAGVLKLAQLAGCPPDVVDQVRKDGSVLVELALFELALHILEDEERRLPEALSNIGAKEEARELWRLEAHLQSWCRQHQQWYPRGMLHRNTLHISGSRFKFAEMMASLEEQGVIDAHVVVDTGGRPAWYYKPREHDMPKPKSEPKP